MKKLFTLAAAVLASFSLAWAQTPSIALTAKTSVIADWNKTYDNVTISVTGAGFADKKPCGVSSNEKSMSISSADSHWIEVSCPDGLNKIVIVGSGNSSGTTNYAAPLCVSTAAPFDSTITDIIEVSYTGYDKDCIENEIDLPEGTKSVRLYRRVKVNSTGDRVGSGNNWTPASATGNQTYNITYIEVYAGDSSTPTPTYTATYVANNSINQANVVDDAAKKVRANMFEAEEGFTFAGWNTAADGSGIDYEVGAALESDITLYAQWEEITACTNLVPASSGADPAVGDEIALSIVSVGGQIFVADMKASGDIKYTDNGLQIGGGGKDSLRVELNNYLKEGSIISLELAAGATSERGLNIQTLGKSTVYQAKWTPAAAFEEKTFNYVVPAGSPLIGKNMFLLQRNNTVYLMNITVANCGAAVPGAKTIVSTTEELKAAAINDMPLSAEDSATLLSSHTLILEDSYVEAPVVKFTKHIVITYDDESTKEYDEVISVTSQLSSASTWGASVTINGIAYSVYTVKATSYTVTYKEGEQVLGTEVVAANAHPAEYAQYELKPLFSFDGWYKDAALTQAVDSIKNEVISSNITYYAKFSKAYAQSINIEQLVLDESTKYDIKSALIAKGYAYSNINDLDSLNDLDKKPNRNYAFLGLKLKAVGASISLNLKAGDSIAVKFGNCPDSLYSIINNDTTYIVNNTAEYGYKAGAADEVVKFVTIKGSTLVLKQIMINEAIAEVELPDPSAYAITVTAENGKLDVAWAGKKQDIAKVNALVGETITLTATPNSGYVLASITVDGEPLQAVDSVYSFVMPAKAVEVAATFESEGTAIDNADAAAKAVKVLRDGVLFIEKNGVRYNAQGAVVR